mmetsp:Transcript_28084/g.65619  ORF Transcript_28084/g.65619 Transcript_28084/m.65619 type:complete len:204 (+) Transcript_28084:1272-1883(+)
MYASGSTRTRSSRSWTCAKILGTSHPASVMQRGSTSSTISPRFGSRIAVSTAGFAGTNKHESSCTWQHRKQKTISTEDGRTALPRWLLVSTLCCRLSPTDGAWIGPRRVAHPASTSSSFVKAKTACSWQRLQWQPRPTESLPRLPSPTAIARRGRNPSRMRAVPLAPIHCQGTALITEPASHPALESCVTVSAASTAGITSWI